MKLTVAQIVESFWGSSDLLDGEYRVPLPITDEFVLMFRARLDGRRLLFPPYMVFQYCRKAGAIEVMLCMGDGRRASHDPSWEDESQFIYADDENLPKEWRGRIAKHVRMIRETRPDVAITFRSSPDDLSTR